MQAEAGSSPGRALRALLESGELVVAPGCGDALSARLVEEAGFPMAYISGGWASGTRGYPDAEILTLTEMAQNARFIAQAVSVPVIADADTGFGGHQNVHRTVREFELNGLAGVQIEDQVSPKKCGLMGDKPVIRPEEMATKIRVAVDARRNDDFVIVARTDALDREGLDAVLRRGEAYLEAGADVLFVEGMQTQEEVRAVAETFRGRHLLFNRTPRGHAPMIPFETLHELGYGLVILPMHIVLAAVAVARELLAELRQTGACESFEHRMVAFDDFFALVGSGELAAREQRYLVEPVQP